MEISNGVFMLNTNPQGHVFLIRGEENILVDTGLPWAGKKILAELEDMGVQPQTVGRILLTHHDIDHIGNARMLGEATGAKIFAPKEDIPYITGQLSRPGIKRAIPFFLQPKVPDKIIPYGREDLEAVRVISAPGHTPGHVILQYENVIFAGDLLRTLKGAPAPMANFMNGDSAMAAKSIGILKTLDFDWLLPSHGDPLRTEDLREFIKNY
jgi:glyoxylase-like metal-dependent hydrolase (beta-lactamase superfamily II)